MRKQNRSSIFQWVKTFTIRKKLLLSYFALIFIPLALLTLVTYITVSTKYEEQIRYSSTQSFEQAYRFLEYKLDSLIRSSDIVYYDNKVQTILNRNREAYVKDIIQQNIDMSYLDTFLNNFVNGEDVYRVALYVQNGLMFSNQNINFSNINVLKKSNLYKKLMESKDKVLWLPPENVGVGYNGVDEVKVVSLLRKIRDSNALLDIIGAVKVSILESNVKDIMLKASSIKNAIVYIQNSDGKIICSTNTRLLQKSFLQSMRDKLGNGDASWKTMIVGREKYAVIARDLDNTDWKMITAIPYSEIFMEGNQIRDLMVGLMLFLGALSYFLAFVIARSITGKISLLTENMIRVQEGEFDVAISTNGLDEIDQLMNSFNYMVKKINVLLQEQYQSGRDIKNAELKSLQSQINPHFLYNTLDLINWKAIDYDVPEITEISQSLAKFYKLSLNKGKAVVTIREEIEHVTTYVQIQNLRFDNRIHFIVELPEELYPYAVIKIILQPLVENSILHGVLENREQQEGTIRLTGSLEGEVITLLLEDDGVGMSEEKVSELLLRGGSKTKSGYGVRNIDNRMKLCYGNEFGLSFESRLGIGTKVRICFPAVKMEQDSMIG